MYTIINIQNDNAYTIAHVHKACATPSNTTASNPLFSLIGFFVLSEIILYIDKPRNKQPPADSFCLIYILYKKDNSKLVPIKK